MKPTSRSQEAGHTCIAPSIPLAKRSSSCCRRSVRHQVSFYDLTFLLFRQRVEYRAQLAANIPKDCFPSSFGHEYDMVLAVPLGVG
jgi:hypothetical protein